MFPNGKRGIDLSNEAYNEIKNEALKYNTKNEFKNNSNRLYQKSKRYDILDEVCSHMELQIKPANYWNKQTIKEEALKYNKKRDFCKKSQGASLRAYSLGIMDEVCKHMDVVTKKWDLKSVKNEALKYTKRFHFSKESNSAYDWARRYKVLDEVCKHMK